LINVFLWHRHIPMDDSFQVLSFHPVSEWGGGGKVLEVTLSRPTAPMSQSHISARPHPTER
jgi:hypothetical protein